MLAIFNISSDEDAVIQIASSSSRVGLRMCMTLIPIFVLVIAAFVFKKKYNLTDSRLEEINGELAKKRAADNGASDK